MLKLFVHEYFVQKSLWTHKHITLIWGLPLCTTVCVAASDWKVLVCSDGDLSGIHSVQGWLQSTLCGTLHSSAFSQVLPLACWGKGWFCKFFTVMFQVFGCVCVCVWIRHWGGFNMKPLTNMHAHTHTQRRTKWNQKNGSFYSLLFYNKYLYNQIRVKVLHSE